MNRLSSSRASGILLHPTALPGKHGIGDMGDGAFAFIDALAEGGQSLWQILPLGPIGYGESPYSPFSTFAGEELLISLDRLKEWGLLEETDTDNVPAFDDNSVDYDAVRAFKKPLLIQACDTFLKKIPSALKRDWERFLENNAEWLNDYALFTALHEEFHGIAWNEDWDRDIMKKTPEAVAKWSLYLKKQIERIKVIQFFFDFQWKKIKEYANQNNVRIIGDVPIFVSPDSADVWANRHLFLTDENCRYTSVAGVPPDYFSPTGQRWGNPLYDWKAMEDDGFRWWIARIRRTAELVDIIRIDHFRGLRAFWKIPSKEKTAEKGKWIKAPGEKLFAAISRELPHVEIIAEDLGLITEDVVALRKKLHLPGMKILQFAFEFNAEGRFNADNIFLPHNYETDAVVYTGTHDNDTTVGWYRTLSEPVRDLVRRYYGISGDDIAWDLIRSASSSRARYAVFPMQDLLSLDSWARTNTPATVGSNWRWRLNPQTDILNPLRRLRDLTYLYGRLPWERK